MASRKAPPPAPAPFNLEVLRAVREKLGAANRDDGEVFTFAPDPDAVASWLQGGVAFGIPLGSPPAILGDLAGSDGVIFGSDDPPSDPLLLDTETLDVNEHNSHYLSIEVSDGVICSVSYEMRGWSYSDDVFAMHQGKRTGHLNKKGVPLPRHDNTLFRAVLAKALPAAGFVLKAPPARAGKKERATNGGGVRVSWSRHRAESLFDSVELTVHAWQD